LKSIIKKELSPRQHRTISVCTFLFLPLSLRKEEEKKISETAKEARVG
jgi:hypothetical protein